MILVKCMSRLKQFKTIDEQIEILKDKGLIINDVEKTKEILLRENYFFINGYRHVFFKSSKDKEFLTQDELKTLASTPCDIPVLRNASLFSCLTGLRISDILNLKWENLCTAPDLGHCIRLRTQKTQTEALLPISYEAYALCGEPGTGKVFKELRRCMTGYPLKAWIKKAGIQKHITFHVGKHCTFSI